MAAIWNNDKSEVYLGSTRGIYPLQSEDLKLRFKEVAIIKYPNFI